MRWLISDSERLVARVQKDGWVDAGRGKVKFREMGGLVQGEGG